MGSRKAVEYLLVVALLVNFSFPTAFAQTVGGTILGAVKDQTGARLPGAVVSVSNIATGVTREVLTNETGAFNVVNLQPGSYEVHVTMPGFASGVKKDITLNVGAEKIHLKAKTNEGVDAIGRGEAIAAHVVATLTSR